MTTNLQVITGGCFCGNVRYEISHEIIKQGVCHCKACQHLTGGAAWPFIVVKSESLHILGDFKEFTRPGASGYPVHVGFCSHCGSTVFGRPEVWPHIHTVSASSLDTIKDFSPEMHVWTEDAQSWILFHPDTPQFLNNPKKNN